MKKKLPIPILAQVGFYKGHNGLNSLFSYWTSMNSLFHFVMIFEFVVPLLEKQQEFVVPPSKKCVIPPLENSLVLSPDRIIDCLEYLHKKMSRCRWWKHFSILTIFSDFSKMNIVAKFRFLWQNSCQKCILKSLLWVEPTNIFTFRT